MGQHQAAIADYSEAIRLKPDDTEAYNNRGFAWVELGNWKQAGTDILKALALGLAEE